MRRIEQPSEGELRREGRRRLLIGGVLFLLMLTLVSMASLLNDARDAAAGNAQTAANGTTVPVVETSAAANEPLGDTSAPVVTAVANGAAPVAQSAPAPMPEERRLVVPDLQPDPQLRNSATRQ